MTLGTTSAVQIDRFGGPEVLVKREVILPPLGAHDILVRITHAGINFMNIHTRQGKYATSRTYPMQLPVTLGMEGAGDVMKIGTAVTHITPGERVGYCLVRASYAHYAVLPADRAVRIPAALGSDMAAASLGKDTLRSSLRVTRKKGLVMSYGTASGAVSDLDPIELGEAGSLFLTRPRLADHVAGSDLQHRATYIYRHILEGKLRIAITNRYNFTIQDINAAHSALANRALVGKPLLHVSQTSSADPIMHSRGISSRSPV